MKTIVIIATLLLTTTSISLKLILKRMIKLKIKTKSKPIDEDAIQEIVNGITNGLVPRIVLAKICQDYFLTNSAQAALSGDSVVKSLEMDLPEDLASKGFGFLWQVCENNGAANSSIGNYNIIAALVLEITGIIWVTKITSRVENLL